MVRTVICPVCRVTVEVHVPEGVFYPDQLTQLGWAPRENGHLVLWVYGSVAIELDGYERKLVEHRHCLHDCAPGQGLDRVPVVPVDPRPSRTAAADPTSN